MKWVFLFFTILLVTLPFFRWTEIVGLKSIPGDALISYEQDRWTGQTWAIYYPPNGDQSYPDEFPVIPDDRRFVSNDEFVQQIALRHLRRRR